MALALYVAAAVMVVGGLLAIYFGADIIVMERGWTMVIAGSVFAGTGALLAGIAAAVGRLQAVETELVRLGGRLQRSAAASPFPQGEAAEASAASLPELDGGRGDVAGLKDLEIAPEPVLAPSAPSGLTVTAGVEDDAAGREPASHERPPRVAFVAEDRMTAGNPPATTDEPAPAATVVGTYNSGGNFYIMYSDGSIEAETPAGKFRFDSLDELKDFIARGGDKVKATSS